MKKKIRYVGGICGVPYAWMEYFIRVWPPWTTNEFNVGKAQSITRYRGLTIQIKER